MPETEEDGRRYGRRYWRGGPGWGASDQRPPWWPAGETWPPTGWQGPPWRRMRGRFLARVAIFVTLLVFIAVGGATLVFLLLASALGAALPAPHGALLAVLAIIVAVLLGAGVRRAAAPIGDLIEAAGRVEAGDYSVRVPEHGAREIRGLARAFNQMAGRLEQDAVQRRRLLADVSHELRTPLSVIQGNLEALLDGVHLPDHEHLASLLDSSRTLSRLVDDLRTLSLAEAGELRLHREPTDLAQLLRDAIAGFQAAAEAANVTLDLEVADDLPSVDIDPTRTQQVLANLLSNALRHTPEGGRVSVRATPAGPAHMAVEVEDTGTGMSAEVAGRIFERFFRGPDSGGSGLGLPIARELIAGQGGEISAKSREGKGTTIRFTVPALA
jgi:signal transduction histidine kinase